MNEFIKKLIERLEALKKLETDREDNCDENGHWNNCEDAFEDGESNGRYQAVMKIMRIVNQLAEEYNNGWIPVSSGSLPKENEEVLATVIIQSKLLVMEIAYHPHWLEDEDKMIAWMPKPSAYQPKGE